MATLTYNLYLEGAMVVGTLSNSSNPNPAAIGRVQYLSPIHAAHHVGVDRPEQGVRVIFNGEPLTSWRKYLPSYLTFSMHDYCARPTNPFGPDVRLTPRPEDSDRVF